LNIFGCRTEGDVAQVRRKKEKNKRKPGGMLKHGRKWGTSGPPIGRNKKKRG